MMVEYGVDPLPLEWIVEQVHELEEKDIYTAINDTGKDELYSKNSLMTYPPCTHLDVVLVR